MVKNILIISTFYPPIQHIATNRIYSFAKYLSQQGYNITVLTVSKNLPIDETIELKNVAVYRIEGAGIFRPANFITKTNCFLHYAKCLYNKILYWLQPNTGAKWIESAITAARELVKEKNIDCVISSFPPLDAHEVAKVIKQENPNLKWILDMRDAMSWCPRISQRQQQLYKVKEQEYFKAGDGLLAVSKPQVEQFRRQCAGKIPVYEMRNGYDFNVELKAIYTECFCIMFTGTFYGNITPDSFLKALADLVAEKKLVRIKVEMIGVVKPFHIPLIVKNMVKVKTRLPYNEVIKYIKEHASALLLILPKSLEKGVYSGKIYDYLGCGKPILGLVPKDDVAAQLIEEARAGYVAENENIEEIKKVTMRAYNDWKNKIPFQPDIQVVKQHHREEQVKGLALFMESLFYGEKA